jgi:hypothetical protein
VDDEFFASEALEKWFERKTGERIDQQIVPGYADLDEAEFFEIAVQTVRLSVYRDAAVRREERKRVRERE